MLEELLYDPFTQFSVGDVGSLVLYRRIKVFKGCSELSMLHSGKGEVFFNNPLEEKAVEGLLIKILKKTISYCLISRVFGVR